MKMKWFHNLGWKLLSLACAYLLWVALNGSQQLTTSVSAPVRYRNIGARLDISSEMVEEVHLILRGPGGKLQRLNPETLPLIVDLSSIKTPGEHTFSVSAASFRLPQGVELERSVPSQIRLTLENRASREVPVNVKLTPPPRGWRVSQVEVEPKFLNVLGPESHVSRIIQIETDPVDLSAGGSGPVSARVMAYAGDPQVSFAGSPMVQARITLEPVK